MNVLEARVALRQRTFLDVLDLAVRFVFAHKAEYGKTALAVLLPSFGFTLAIGEWTGWPWAWTFAVLMGFFAQAPFTALASRLVFAERVRVREAIGAAAQATGRLLGVRFVQALAICGASIFALVPGWLVSGVYLFVLEAALLERANVGTALKRSSRISGTNYGEAVMAALVLILAPVLAVVLVDLVGRTIVESVFESRPPESLWTDGGGWLPLLGFWLVQPILATARFFLYIDVRTRTEGWDIQTRFAAIAARAKADEEARAA
jgi:hypothetical protein